MVRFCGGVAPLQRGTLSVAHQTLIMRTDTEGIAKSGTPTQ
jgi:hypothetical protein